MGEIKRWSEINATHLGLCVLQAMLNLERGEDGEVEVELTAGGETVRTTRGDVVTTRPEESAGRWLKIAPDPANKRIVIFEIQKPEVPG